MLKEGENQIPNVEDEAISLQGGLSCYKLTHKNEHSEPIKAYESKITIEFDKRFTENELAPRLTFLTTSEANSYGAEFASFRSGDPLKTIVVLNQDTSIKIKPKMVKYVKDIGDKCEEKNYWSLVEESFVPKVKEMCPTLCTAFILPNNSITDICKTQSEVGCASSIYMEAMKDVKMSYNGPCTTMEYDVTGITEEERREEEIKLIDGFPELVGPPSMSNPMGFKIPKDWNGKPTVMVSYTFDKPEKMTVRREYLVVDFEKLIGLVGGTMGLFLGFAFTDTALLLIDLINAMIIKIYAMVFETSGKNVTAKVQPKA